MNQLEELKTMREVIFSSDGWGSGNVNQNKNWDASPSKSTFWITQNNGTEYWDVSLRIKSSIVEPSNNWGESNQSDWNWGGGGNDHGYKVDRISPNNKLGTNIWGEPTSPPPLRQSPVQNLSVNQLLESIIDLKGALETVQDNLSVFEGNVKKLPELNTVAVPEIHAANSSYSVETIWSNSPTNSNKEKDDWPITKPSIEGGSQPEPPPKFNNPWKTEAEVMPLTRRYAEVTPEPMFSSSIWSFNPNDPKRINEDGWNQPPTQGNTLPTSHAANNGRPILGKNNKANQN